MASQSNIAPGTKITGRIQADGDLEVLGHVEGSITASGGLTIGEGATLKCDLQGRAVEIGGAVAGDVRAEQAIVLLAGARVQGDLSAPSIGIRPGALVRGHVQAGGGVGAHPRPRQADENAIERAAPAAQPARPKPARRSDTGTARRGQRGKTATRAAPPPVMPKASRRAKRRSTTKAAAASAAPDPVVPALKKRTRSKKAKRRGKR